MQHHRWVCSPRLLCTLGNSLLQILTDVTSQRVFTFVCGSVRVAMCSNLRTENHPVYTVQ